MKRRVSLPISGRRGIRLLSTLKYAAFPMLPLAGYFVVHGVGLVIFALVCLALHSAVRMW